MIIVSPPWQFFTYISISMLTMTMWFQIAMLKVLHGAARISSMNYYKKGLKNKKNSKYQCC